MKRNLLLGFVVATVLSCSGRMILMAAHANSTEKKRVYPGHDSLRPGTRIRCSRRTACGIGREPRGYERRLYRAVKNAGWLSDRATLASKSRERHDNLWDIQSGHGRSV